MSGGIRDTIKGGWHPKGKDGKKESWRGDFKGINQISGWMGKGKDPHTAADEHVARPLNTLKDPAAFGPPPKNVHFHGGAALPNQITPDTTGWGAPLSREEILEKQRAEEEETQRRAEEEAKPRGPPVPFRADRTGLSTTNLPPPPGRKDRADGQTPPPLASTPPPGKPKLPPRLPPRQSSNSIPSPPLTYNATTSELDIHKGILNQGALNRLGAAGVSVPGFGIGPTKSKAPLPPPSLLAGSRVSSPPPAPANSSQLNELQSRFSRLSPSSPKPHDPNTGTTFAQKQAALKTAASLRNDPSSVSLSDARNAASTANNFRERHGDQVKSGWQSANKLNAKYGIADKVGSYSGVAVPERTPSAEVQIRDKTDETQFGALGKKKPAPPPPKKRLDLTPTGAPPGAPGAPPALNLATKPKSSLSSSVSKSPPQADLPLDLPSLWFAKTPPAFPPPCINNLPGHRTFASSSSWSSSGVRKTHTFTAVIRHTDNLSATKIRMTWDGSNPGLTVKAEQRHFPPPKILGWDELEEYRKRYSEKIASWCESQKGAQVGNGECWTLAHNALVAVGSSFSSRGQEPCMPSQSYTHGYKIFSFSPPSLPQPRGGVLEAGVVRGDIIQFTSSRFEAKNGSWKLAGMPDHTSVVVGVDQDGGLRVLEQNVGGVKKVVDGHYVMADLVKGDVKIFRAVGEHWVGKLDPSW